MIVCYDIINKSNPIISISERIILKEDNTFLIWSSRLATPLIDLLTIVLYSTLLPILVLIFSRRKIFGSLVVGGGYLLMCVGIFVGKRLQAWPQVGQNENSVEKRSGWVTVLSWPYAIFVVVMIFETGGAFVKGSDLGDWLDKLAGGSTLTLLLAVIVFLVILVLFPLLLLMKARPRIRYDRISHTLFRMFSITSVDLMVLITAAYWEWQLADSQPMPIGLAGKILVFGLGYVVFLMFYAPPRLALISLEPSRWSFAGYAILLGYILWGFMG